MLHLCLDISLVHTKAQTIEHFCFLVSGRLCEIWRPHLLGMTQDSVRKSPIEPVKVMASYLFLAVSINGIWRNIQFWGTCNILSRSGNIQKKVK